MKCVSSREVYRLVAGDFDRDHAAALSSHVTHCQTCKALTEEVTAITRRLSVDPGEFDDPELTEDIMTLIRLGRASQAASVRSRWAGLRSAWLRRLWLPMTAVGAVALVVVTWSQLGSMEASGFQARGMADSANRWVSIEAFRGGSGGYEPVQETMAADDPLAFSYTNRPAGSYRYLMIFAVSDDHRVFWYYPAHEDGAKNPMSVPISSADEAIELPDQVRHDLEAGYMRLFGLFSEEPLDVHTVESTIAGDLKVAGGASALREISLEGIGQHSFRVQVVPRARED